MSVVLLAVRLESGGGERVLEQKKSPYSTVRVIEKNGRVYMYLGEDVQSGWEPARPDYMLYAYSRLIAAALTAWWGLEEERPGRVLLIGLGGCDVCRHISKYYPGMQLQVAELDPVVHEFAMKHFAVSPKIKVHIGDGRAYLKNNPDRYDIIILDAFGEKYIPPELMTREFLGLVRARLRDRGLVIANTWSSSVAREHEDRTYFEVFGPYYDLRHPEAGNRIILTAGEGLIGDSAFRRKMRKTKMRRRITSFEIETVLKNMKRVDKRPAGEVLTDANVRRLLGQ